MAGDGVGKLLGHAGSGAHECEIDAAEGVAFLKSLHCDLTATEAVARAGARGAAEKTQLVDRERLLVEHLQKFLADSAAGPDYCNVH